MKRYFKTVLCIAAACCIALAFAACRGGNEDLVTEAGKNEDGKVKLVFLRAGTEDYKKDAFAQMIKGFESENPDYAVEYQEAPWGDDFETKMNTGFASGTAPDVIHYSLSSIGARVPMGQYECLDEYASNWEGLGDLYDSVKEAGSIAGKLYGIPYTPDARMFAINTELFRKAGLDPESPPTNWSELLEAHKKLLVRDSSGTVVQCGLGVPTSGENLNHYLELFVVQNGLDNLVDEGNNEILFTRPEAVEAMEFLKQVKDAGLIEWNNAQADQNPFKNGTAAMTLISENEFNNMNTGDRKGQIKFAPMFAEKTKGTFCGMHFMFMSAASKQKEGAWKLIKYMCGKDSMQIWMDTAKAAPVRASLKDRYLERNKANGSIIMEAIAIGKASPKVPYFNSLRTYVDSAMEQVFYGQAGAEEALDMAAKKVQEEIDNQ